MKNFDLVNYLAKNKLQEAIELISLYPENPDEVAQKVADHFTETDDLGLIYSVKPESLKMTSQGAYFDLDTKAGPNTPGEDFKDENGFGIDYYLGDSAGGSFVIKSEEGLDDDFFVIRNMASRNAKVGSVTPEGEVIFSTQEDNLEEKKSNKMTKAQLKEMIRQNILNELAEEITEDTDMEFGDPDVGLSKLYADFYEGLEEQEEEVEDTEKVDVDVEEPAAAAPAEPTLTDAEREIQSNLDKALQAAQELGNEKLIQQIGNTITFFTRDFVVKEGEESVNEAFLAVTTNGVTKADDKESFISQMEDAGYKLVKILGPEDNHYKDHPTIDHTWTYGLPKFSGIIGPMKDGDRFRYEDQETYDRMSLEEKKDKEYYKDAEADDAEHIKALEKDMEDDKESSEKLNESMFPLFKKIIK